jgi:hypothetical protein
MISAPKPRPFLGVKLGGGNELSTKLVGCVRRRYRLDGMRLNQTPEHSSEAALPAIRSNPSRGGHARHTGRDWLLCLGHKNRNTVQNGPRCCQLGRCSSNLQATSCGKP